MSIKPEYTEKIFSGEKKYEFRKQKPRELVEMVLVYESNPSKNIVGCFTIKKILSGSPENIWKKCKNNGGIEKENYFAYCNDKKVIHAMEIDEFFEFDCPINPFKIISDFKPPQNFIYLENSTFFRALENEDGICKCLEFD
ncbi:MAG: ASCH domain-containing protein [Thermoplasmata archaeon]|nr:ASCH domain-containing protein [Thermoplasmata archaeon]